MGTVAIHESVTIWGTSVGEEDSDLVHGLWSVLPEIEDHVWISQVGGWVSLLGVEEVWELDWVVDEEHWGVVSNHVVVTLFGVEFDGEASWVSDGISGTSLTSNGGESKEKWGLLADLVQESGSGELGNIIGDLEDSMST